MRKRFSILVYTVFFAVLLLGAQTVFAAGFTIALANSYAGNAWRTQMVKDFTDTAQAEVKSGLIKDFKVLDANGSVSTQISQLNDLILQHVSAIVIDAASTTALNWPYRRQLTQASLSSHMIKLSRIQMPIRLTTTTSTSVRRKVSTLSSASMAKATFWNVGVSLARRPTRITWMGG